MTSRRSFIKNSGLLALTVPFAKLSASSFIAPAKIQAFGIQLYMVRDDMGKDAVGTLKQLGRMGYTQMESYGGDKGMFWGMSNVEFKKAAGDYGLTLISSHFNDDDVPFEKKSGASRRDWHEIFDLPLERPAKIH